MPKDHRVLFFLLPKHLRLFFSKISKYLSKQSKKIRIKISTIFSIKTILRINSLNLFQVINIQFYFSFEILSIPKDL